MLITLYIRYSFSKPAQIRENLFEKRPASVFSHARRSFSAKFNAFFFFKMKVPPFSNPMALCIRRKFSPGKIRSFPAALATGMRQVMFRPAEHPFPGPRRKISHGDTNRSVTTICNK